MRQAIFLNTADLARLKGGEYLYLAVDGQTLTLGYDGRTREARPREPAERPVARVKRGRVAGYGKQKITCHVCKERFTRMGMGAHMRILHPGKETRRKR